MRIGDRLSHDTKKMLREKVKPKPKDKGYPKNQKDWLDLMGAYRDTYKRGPGGAVRRK